MVPRLTRDWTSSQFSSQVYCHVSVVSPVRYMPIFLKLFLCFHQTQTFPRTLMWLHGTAAAYRWPGTAPRTSSTLSSYWPPSTSMARTTSQRKCASGSRRTALCSPCLTCSPAAGLSSAFRPSASQGWSPATARWSRMMEILVSPVQVETKWTISVFTNDIYYIRM